MINSTIKLAVKYLTSNGVIGFPTETVYGLAANAFSEEAIEKIFRVKNRPSNNPLIVHIKSINELDSVAIDVPDVAYRLANEFWPGPLTLILKKHPSIPYSVTAQQETVAVRIPNHSVALELLNQLDFPLVAPSANPYTRISPTTAEHVENYFGDQIDMVLDGGKCSAGIESTIVGFENDKTIIYRLGALAKEDIEKVVVTVTLHQKEENNTVRTPGMHLKHYAPKTHFKVTDSIIQEISTLNDKRIGILSFTAILPNFPPENQYVLSESGSLIEAASNLYTVLHQIDSKGFDVIIAEYLPNHGLGTSINDRLSRAAKY